MVPRYSMSHTLEADVSRSADVMGMRSPSCASAYFGAYVSAALPLRPPVRREKPSPRSSSVEFPHCRMRKSAQVIDSGERTLEAAVKVAFWNASCAADSWMEAPPPAPPAPEPEPAPWEEADARAALLPPAPGAAGR